METRATHRTLTRREALKLGGAAVAAGGLVSVTEPTPQKAGRPTPNTGGGFRTPAPLQRAGGGLAHRRPARAGGVGSSPDPLLRHHDAPVFRPQSTGEGEGGTRRQARHLSGGARPGRVMEPAQRDDVGVQAPEGRALAPEAAG